MKHRPPVYSLSKGFQPNKMLSGDKEDFYLRDYLRICNNLAVMGMRERVKTSYCQLTDYLCSLRLRDFNRSICTQEMMNRSNSVTAKNLGHT